MSATSSVFLFAPLRRDAELLAAALSASNIPAVAVSSFASLLQQAREGNAGSLLMTSEALSGSGLQTLRDVLAVQPQWSDLPVMVLVPGGVGSHRMGSMEEELISLPNLTLLERPIRPVTLVSTVRVALKNRARQLEVKRIMEEREQAAAALIESEKLAAVGRLASSIAHEINNPLEAITNLLYLIRHEDGLSQAGRDYMDTADRELARVSQITSQTLRFHRQSTGATTVEPEALLQEVLEIYKGRLQGSGIHIRQDFAPGVRLTCFEGDIRQVLSNMIGNAFDVMRNGGQLFLRTRNLTWWKTGTAGVMITVCDSGPGMTEAVRQRIFDAFYSTKGIHGTGLGLWISKRIVHKHRGHLSVRSRTDEKHGTIFQLWLPCELAGSADERWHAEAFDTP